jgi:glycosyltransferase involved in cell wall biosynthesis
MPCESATWAAEMHGRSISIVVPVYNGAGSIPELVRQLHLTLPALAAAYEIILVEDDSRDNSWDVIKGIAEGDPLVRGYKMMRNYGQHSALLCGIRAAHYEIVVTMDDDLQHPPEEIRHLLEKLDEGCDVVYGKPQHERHGLFRDLSSQVTKLVLQNAMGAETARSISAFRAIRTKVRAAFDGYDSPAVNLDVLLTWGTTRFTAVEVRHEPRRIGQSNYTFRKLVSHTLNMVTGFSTVPLRLASLLGFAMTAFGLLILAYVIGRYVLEGSPVQGFPFLASTIAIFSGVQMLLLGIIGEYLAGIHFRTMHRPPYVVRTSTEDAALSTEAASQEAAEL